MTTAEKAQTPLVAVNQSEFEARLRGGLVQVTGRPPNPTPLLVVIQPPIDNLTIFHLSTNLSVDTTRPTTTNSTTMTANSTNHTMPNFDIEYDYHEDDDEVQPVELGPADKFRPQQRSVKPVFDALWPVITISISGPSTQPRE